MRPFLTFATVFRGAEQLPEFESSPLTESTQYLIPLMAKGGLCSARPDAELPRAIREWVVEGVSNAQSAEADATKVTVTASRKQRSTS